MSRHVTKVIACFALWKLLLVLMAALSPGPGYDTSTELLFRQRRADSWLDHLLVRLTRWDGLYFATASARGQVFEQQWAFSPVLTRFTSLAVAVLFSHPPASSIPTHALAVILASNVSHLVAVLLLFRLTHDIIPGPDEKRRRIALTTACLHVLSPAGLFLSAPYGESPFAAVHFAGLLCYVKARKTEDAAVVVRALWTLASGSLIALSSTIRSNGLFSGIIFAWDALAITPRMLTMLTERDWPKMVHLCATLLAGLLVAVGYAAPQVVAYVDYCTGGNDRPWCSRSIPSIYSFVQAHYWGVGLFQYWTLSNAPLFALAAPLLMVLMGTSSMAWNTASLRASIPMPSDAREKLVASQARHDERLFLHMMRRLALPQMLLAVLALIYFHIQIINRISSGYPLWYILIALTMHTGAGETKPNTTAASVLGKYAQTMVRASVIYALVQGGLYASFMPPA